MKMASAKRNILVILSDMVSAVVAMAAAFFFRFVLFGGENPVGGFGYHMLWGAIFSPVFVVLFGLFGVYTPHPERSYTYDFSRIVLGSTIGVMLYIDVVFVFRIVDFSRWMILLYYLFLNLFIGARGMVTHRMLRRRCRRGECLRRLLIVGDGEAARNCVRRLSHERDTGAEIIGYVGERHMPGTKCLGSYEQLREILEREAPDEAVIAMDEGRVHEISGILVECENTGVKLALLPICYEYMSRHPFFEDLGGLPLINIRRVALDNPGVSIIKRLFDIICSLLGIIVFSPLMLFAMIGTKLSSPGPVLFRQERIGKDRKPFYMLKFRSMRLNDRSDSAWTQQGDPRRTRFGAFMRRYSIDELPQLFNVLRGDMSLVGPRPEIPKYVDHFKYSVPLYMVRHQVRPGITGWAQINGLRGDTSIEDRVEYDLFYIENWSLLFDLKILLLTPFKGIVNRQESLVKKK